MRNGPTAYHHGDLRDSLLEAGEAVLGELGLKGFTLRECARRAGVSHAAPKHHFGDVTGFLTEIAARGFQRLTARLQAELANANALDDEFIATTRAYIGFAKDHPEHFRVMFRRDLLANDSPSLQHAADQTFTELTNVILRQRGEAQVTTGALGERVRSNDVIGDILIGWCHIHGLAHLQLEQRLPMIDEDAHAQLFSHASSRIAHLLRTDAGNVQDGD